MTSKTTNKFSPEVRARAFRMVLDHASEHDQFFPFLLPRYGAATPVGSFTNPITGNFPF
jgi:hypothetical protein